MRMLNSNAIHILDWNIQLKKTKPCQPLQMLEQDSPIFFGLPPKKKAPGEGPPRSFPSSALLDSSCILQQNGDSHPTQVLSPGATGLATQKQNLECSFLRPGICKQCIMHPIVCAQLMLSNPRWCSIGLICKKMIHVFFSRLHREC